MASFTKEVNPQLAKRPLKISGHLANRGLTSFVKEATGACLCRQDVLHLTLEIPIAITDWIFSLKPVPGHVPGQPAVAESTGN